MLRLDIARHTSEIEALSVDSTGRLALTASRDSTARLWDIQGGHLLHTFRLPISTERGRVTTAALSPDGRVALIGMEETLVDTKAGAARSPASLSKLSANSSLLLFDVPTRQLVRVVEDLPWGLQGLEYSPDGRWVAAGCFFNGLVLLDSMKLNVVSIDREHYALDPIQSLAFSKDGQLATTSGLGFVRNYRVAPNGLQFVAEAELPGGRPAGLDGDGIAFSPEGNRIVVSSVDRPLAHILDSRTLRVVQQLNMPPVDVPNSGAGTVAWLSDGRLAAAGHYRETDGRHALLIWQATGEGPPSKVVIDSVRNTIFQVRRAGNGLAYAAAGPELGLVDSHGAVQTRLGRIGIDMRSEDDAGGLKASADGLRVQFQPFHSSARMVFDVIDRTLLATADMSLTSARTTGIQLTPWKNRGGIRINDIAVEMQHGESIHALAIDRDARRLVLASGARLRAFDLAVFDKQAMPSFKDPPLRDRLSPQERARLDSGDLSVLQHAITEATIENARAYSATTRVDQQRRDGKWSFVPDEAVEALNIPANGDFVVAAYADGTIRWHRLSDGTEVFALFVDPESKRWIIWTPAGYFDCSPNSADLVGWHVNRGASRAADFYNGSQFWDVFYRPDIIRAVARGEDISGLVGDLTVENALQRPPPREISLKTMEGQRPDAQKMSVDYVVRPDQGGVGEIRIFLNGKLIQSDGYYQIAPGKTGASVRQSNRPKSCDPCTGTVSFEPIGGELNEVSVVAFNADNSIQSQAHTIRLTSTLPKRAPEVWIFPVGINLFNRASSVPTLKNARKDVEDFTREFAKRATTLFGEAAVHTIEPLLDQAATRGNILLHLEDLAQRARPQDTVVWFIASHGTLANGGQFGVVPSDAVCADSSCSHLDNLITSNDILEAGKKIRSMRQLLVLDTCQSGGLDNKLASLYDARISLLARDVGLHVYASAQETQAALDGEPGTNGLFTRSLLKGMNGNAADANGDGYVSMVELGDFARVATIAESDGAGLRRAAQTYDPKGALVNAHMQVPVMMHFGTDAPLYRVR